MTPGQNQKKVEKKASPRKGDDKDLAAQVETPKTDELLDEVDELLKKTEVKEERSGCGCFG